MARAMVIVLLFAFAPGTASAASGANGRNWVSRFEAGGNERAVALALSPDGDTVYVTGSAERSSGDYLTISYDAATGTQEWASWYDGPAGSSDEPADIGVSSDGSRVFVTGSTGYQNPDYATVAYDAQTGGELWTAVFDDSSLPDHAHALAVAPNGRRLFVTGDTWHGAETIAYDAATGTQVWAAQADSVGADAGTAIGIDPRGRLLYVTGPGYSIQSFTTDVFTTALRADDGSQKWQAQYDGPLDFSDDYPVALAVEPSRGRVFVTGYSATSGGRAYMTISYDAARGEQRWAATDGGPDYYATALDVAAAPDGSRVYVTGWMDRTNAQDQYATIAYRAGSGKKAWTRTYGMVGMDVAEAIAASPDGRLIAVTGQSGASYSDIATVVYDVTGHEIVALRYSGPGGQFHHDDAGSDLVFSRSSDHLFVTGLSYGTDDTQDWVTIGYGLPLVTSGNRLAFARS
jgi:hypothetical protein